MFSSVPELIGGTPSLKINHGSGTLVLQLPNNIGVADRRWHRLDVRSNSKVRKKSHFFFFFFFVWVGRCGTIPRSSRRRDWPGLARPLWFTGGALHAGSMLQRHHHGDGRCGLVGDDGGPLVLRDPRGHAQPGQVRSMAINKGINSTAVDFHWAQETKLRPVCSLFYSDSSNFHLLQHCRRASAPGCDTDHIEWMSVTEILSALVGCFFLFFLFLTDPRVFSWAAFEYEKLTRRKNLLRSLWPFTAAHNQLTFQGFVVFIDSRRAALAVTVAASFAELQRWKIESVVNLKHGCEAQFVIRASLHRLDSRLVVSLNKA